MATKPTKRAFVRNLEQILEGLSYSLRRIPPNKRNPEWMQAAQTAWNAIQQLTKEERLKMFSATLASRHDPDDTVGRFLYFFGQHFPEETRIAVTPLARKGHEAAWQILAAVLGRSIYWTNNKPLNPFESLTSGQSVEAWPVDTEEIADFIVQSLREGTPSAVDQILSIINGEISLAVLRILVGLISDSEWDMEKRVVTSFHLKAMAEKIADKIPRKEWEGEAEKLALIVDNSDEYFFLRTVVAYVFEFSPTPQATTAVLNLIEDLKQLPAGPLFLPKLQELLKSLENQSHITEAVVRPEMPGVRVALIMSDIARHTDPQILPEIAKFHGDGWIIESQVDPPGWVVKYTAEVIQYCLHMISELDHEDPELADRYIVLLALALSAEGPVKAALDFVLIGAQRGLDRNQPEKTLPFLEIASRMLLAARAEFDDEPLVVLGSIGLTSGQHAEKSGRLDLAESHFALVAKMIEGVNPELEGIALGALGGLHSLRQRWQEARQYLERSCELLETTDCPGNLATSLMELGGVEMNQGDHENARRHLEKAESIATPIESTMNRTCLPHCLNSLVELGIREGQSKDELLEMIERALKLVRARTERDLESLLLDKKEKLAGELSLAERFRIGYNSVKATYEGDFWAAVYAEIREGNNSERCAREDGFYSIGELPSTGLILLNDAIFHYVNAYIRLAYAEMFEVFRHELSNKGDTHFLKLKTGLIQHIVQLLVQKGDFEWALEFADRAKSRSLLTLCCLKRVDTLKIAENAGVSRVVTSEVRRTAQQLSDLTHRQGLAGLQEERGLNLKLTEWIAAAPKAFRDSFNLNDATEDYEALKKEIEAWKRSAEPGSKVDPTKEQISGWLQTRQIPKVACLLAPDERLIEYCLTETEGYAFLLDPTGQIHYASIDAPLDRLQSLIQQVTSNPQITQNNSAELVDWRPVLSELYDYLIRPFDTQIHSKLKEPAAGGSQVRKLILVPDGFLYDLPFAPLWDKQREHYLVDDFELNVALSGAMFNMLATAASSLPRPFSFSGMANPLTRYEDLGAAEQELTEVIDLLPSETRVDTAMRANLNRQRFLQLCQDADIIHFAGHMKFVPTSPLESFIPLAPLSDGTETRWKEDRLSCADLMMQCQMKAYLLFLSACESGRSRVLGQGEVTGFLRAAFLCGAKNVVYSLWPVPDTTETVMTVKEFYRHLIVSKDACPTSLRKAMLAFRDLHPWFWAGFQVCGF